ncbi:MAG TPA: ribbon-helix-helix domain-containing protein, partial [Parvularculaceae bacterium]|nr:ribbon-helix-helix domain-containing protein [Parvularculaceae bacterium]
RSITIKGHRTSIALENEFWTVLDETAAARRISLPALVAEIDRLRLKQTPTPGLASALRIFALDEARRSGVGHKAG